MSEHSPTPWTYEVAGEQHYGEVDDFPFVIRSEDGWNIAASIGDVPDLPAEANAAFIVHAVNAHDEMVYALRGVERFLVRQGEAIGASLASNLMLSKVRSALARSSQTKDGE